jgi:hypothetical protein
MMRTIVCTETMMTITNIIIIIIITVTVEGHGWEAAPQKRQIGTFGGQQDPRDV